MSRTLFIYVFKDLVKIFLMASGALAGIMSFGGLLRPLTQNGLDGSQVLLLLYYFMSAMSTYSLPIAALFATTVVYGRMSADNEITACRACGISFLSMTLPAALLGVLVAVASVFLLCFKVPTATMRIEQVLYSNLAKVIAHQIEQKHETHFDKYTVFAQSAELPPQDRSRPDEQAVLLKGPLIVSYYRPADKDRWYQCAKEFWSSSEAIAYIRQDPADDSVKLTVHLKDGVITPRDFNGPERTNGGVGEAIFGPVEMPSGIEQKTKFMNIIELKRLERDPSRGASVQKVKRQFVKEDQARDLALQIAADFTANNGTTTLVSGTDSYTIATTGKIEAKGDKVTFTGSVDKPVHVRQISNGLDRLSREGTLCVLSIVPDPEHGQAFLTLDMKDAMEVGETRMPAPLSKQFTVALPDSIASYVNRTADQYLSHAIADPQSRNKLQFAWTDLIDHIEAEMHARAAFVVSCLLLVLVGSSLGMMFRSGNFLTAFAVSVVPAMFSTVLIVTGQHTAEATPTDMLTHTSPLGVGIAIIWSGNVMIFIAATTLLWRLQRR